MTRPTYQSALQNLRSLYTSELRAVYTALIAEADSGIAGDKNRDELIAECVKLLEPEEPGGALMPGTKQGFTTCSLGVLQLLVQIVGVPKAHLSQNEEELRMLLLDATKPTVPEEEQQ